MIAALVSGWAWLPVIAAVWLLLVLLILAVVHVGTSTPTPRPYPVRPAWMREGL